MDDGHTILLAGAIDFPTEDMIDIIPIATETGDELELPPPAVANFTLPPALTEEMESIPVAVVQVV